MNLDGWTKVGDKVTPTGKWIVYIFKGKEFDDVTVLESFLPDDESGAILLFKATVDKMKRGAIWLISPDGTVASLRFIRP